MAYAQLSISDILGDEIGTVLHGSEDGDDEQGQLERHGGDGSLDTVEAADGQLQALTE